MRRRQLRRGNAASASSSNGGGMRRSAFAAALAVIATRALGAGWRCGSFCKQLRRYTLHSVHLDVELISSGHSIRHGLKSRLVHVLRVSNESAEASHPLSASVALEMLALLVLNQNFLSIEAPVTVVAKWLRH